MLPKLDMTVTDRMHPPSARSLRDGKSAPGSQYRPKKFDAPFICWDGEGYTDDRGKHHYMMLVASTGDYLMAPEGRSLTTRECFGLLLRVAAAQPYANHVFFAGGYDYNMILQDLGRGDIERLHKFGRTYWDTFNVALRSRKSLWIRDRLTGQSVTLYDSWANFQSSFVKALKAWGIEVETQVETGKAGRGSFAYADRQEILTYCRAELRAFVTLMDDFRDGLREADIRVARWDGPGAVAAALYKSHETKTHKHSMEGYSGVSQGAQSAYFGGRIEGVRFGNHEASVWYYDLNSAYPAAIATLPSLAGGRWVRSKTHDPGPRPLSLYRLEWDWTNTDLPFYPLPFRRADGTIAFFPRGRGWYHAPEYEAVRRHFPKDSYRVLESLVFKPLDPAVRPFAWVQEMYDLRAQWKREGRGAEKVLKLGLNSLYGKMVQQLGWSVERGIPPYHQLEWGGYVTSFCRAALYEAAMRNPESVVGFETDGLITTADLGLETSSALGGWGHETYSGISYVQPGVYWLQDPDTGDWVGKHRGFNPGSLARSDVLEAWATKRSSVTAETTRFVGMGLALHTAYNNWCQWLTTPRELSVWPDNPKRSHPASSHRGRTPNRGLITADLQWDNPAYWTGAEDSEPYPLQWAKQGRYTFAMMMADREQDSLLYDDQEDD